jgi:phosphatidylglycerophosphatase A
MNWYAIIATLGPVGYLPASGTVATLFTLPCVFWLKATHVSSLEYLIICAVMTVIALRVTYKTLDALKRYDDPSQVVIDEVVGCLVTFIGISWSSESALLGFLLFRFFDIFKLAGISYVERLQGEWGIVFDDVYAGLLSNLILRLLL